MSWRRERAESSPLVARLQAGDQQAWATWYGDLAGPLAGYARSKGADDVDDLVGDVFAAAAERIGRFEGDEAGLRSWLFTIAHHRLADHHRRRRRRATEPVEPGSFDEVEIDGDAIEAAADRLDALGALTLLDGLTDDQREVLVLRILGELTVAETAEVMDRPPGAVKALQHRALARIQRQLGAAGANDPYPSSSLDDDTGET